MPQQSPDYSVTLSILLNT